MKLEDVYHEDNLNIHSKIGDLRSEYGISHWEAKFNNSNHWRDPEDIRLWYQEKRHDTWIMNNVQQPMKGKVKRMLGIKSLKINYLEFTDYPYCKYMPIYDSNEHVLYLANQYFWENPILDRTRVVRDNQTIPLEWVRDIVFINNYLPIANKPDLDFYYLDKIDDVYLRFLKKYSLIDNNPYVLNMPCWKYNFRELRYLYPMENDFYYTDKKKIGNKIIKIATMTWIH